MRPDDPMHSKDGKGKILTGRITDDHKRHCRVRIESRQQQAEPSRRITIGISLLKNTSRFEWFLEKAAELGITRIIPLVCKRTEKEKFRMERMQGICTSAMLQSRQVWLTQLDNAIEFDQAIQLIQLPQKFIGYCDPATERKPLSSFAVFEDAGILIGPEGDFTPDEFHKANSHGFIPVSLGETRLRTETAAIVAATLLMTL